MLVITHPTVVPPGGAFIARHPISNVEFRAHTVDGVRMKFNSHCRANGYPEVTPEGIEQNICANQPHLCEESSSPTFGQMAANLFHDALEWAKAGFPASRKVAEERLAICVQCSYWGGATGGTFLSGSCGKCGCSGLKLALHSTRCPLGKWEPV